jgi:regulator of sigma E protease
MDTLLAVVEFIIALSVLAFFHELGHFLTSKMFGIQVEEFGIGFPPRAKKLFTWRETEFTLNWIPFGAFVRPKGENDPAIAGGLGAANPWKRLVVLLGGPIMNLLVGIILFSILYIQVGAPDTSRVMVSGTSPNSPAAAVGLQSGDIVTKINDTPVTSTDQMSALVHAAVGQQISISIDRNGQASILQAVPRTNPPAGEGALGVLLTNPSIPIGLFQAVPKSIEMEGLYARELFLLPGRLIAGTISPDQGRIVGPKGMFDMFAQARSRDIQDSSSSSPVAQSQAVNVLGFFAIISTALGITNLLPIPALDGGRILFILPELLFRKRVPPKYENMVHAIGFSALLVLIAFITLQDFINPIVLP